MADILSIQSPIVFDDSIKNYEIHMHQPYTISQFKNTDEIRIAIQHQDLCVLPSQSSLHITGKITKPNGTALAATSLVNNAICHMFEEIRYELNGVEIEKCKNPGLTCTMKGWLSFNPSEVFMLGIADWTNIAETESFVDNAGNFDVSIPLRMNFGSAEDYDKIVVNMKHELILVRSRNDLNSVLQTNTAAQEANPVYENFKLVLNRIEWLMPYVNVSDKFKFNLLNFIGKDKPIDMSFRTWELYEYPQLPQTNRHVWTVKISNQLEKPRLIALGFQTDRKDQESKNASQFDHCQITNFQLFLNSQYYPYGNLNLDINQNQFSRLYDKYVKFQSSYYNKDPQLMLKKKISLNICLLWL